MQDYLIRAVTDDGFVRAFGCVSTSLVQSAHEFHNTTPVASAALGRLLTAAALMGSMLKGEKDLITLQLNGGGPLGRVLAVSGPESMVKGYVDNPSADLPLNENGKLDVGKAVGTDGFFTVIQDMGLKEPYIGKIPLVSGEVGDDLAKYYAVSEQVPSVVALGVLVDKDLSIKSAGGFIIQVMPGATDEDIDKLEANISSVTSVTEMLQSGLDIEDIVGKALEGFDFHITDKKDIGYHCNCSRERVRRVLSSIGRDEIEAIIREDGKAELDCHFCNEKYHFDIDELNEILSEISGKE